MENLWFILIGEVGIGDRAGMPVLQTRQRPTGFIVWGLVGRETGKLRVQIIDGSGAYVHRDTVRESQCLDPTLVVDLKC